jgi:RNA recognition motif-containing protein
VSTHATSATQFVRDFSHSFFFRCSFPPTLIPTSLSTASAAMSRLIIKNLPSYLTPEALRKHFSGQAAKKSASTSSSPPKTFTLTDAKIAYKPDGTSRRFGFVGFKTEKEAEEAKRWFDRSFIDSMRINVEVVDVSFLRSLHNISPPSMLFRKLIVVRGSGIEKSDQRNVENLMSIPCHRTSSSSLLPLTKRTKRQNSTMGVVIDLFRPTRILKSIRR